MAGGGSRRGNLSAGQFLGKQQETNTVILIVFCLMQDQAGGGELECGLAM